MATATATSSKPARPPITHGYLAQQTLDRLAARAVLARELGRFRIAEARAAEKSRAVLARELATFSAIEAKYFPAAAKLHKMADVEGKSFQHTDRAYLARWIGDRNRRLRSPEHKAIKAAYEEGRRRARRLYPNG